MEFLKNLPQKPKKLNELISAQAGSVASMSLSKIDDVHMTLLAFSPGEGISEEKYENDMFYYCVEGNMQILLDNSAHALSSGDCFLAPRGVLHELKPDCGFKLLQITVGGIDMDFMKNIKKSKVIKLKDMVSYEEGKIISITLAQKEHVGITLFAFAAGEGVSTHSAPGDAMVYVLDGKANITVGDEEFVVGEGETIVMPANVPHAVKAKENFKMLLTVVK